MSWDGYCDQLAAKGAEENSVCGRDNGVIWASRGLSPSPPEVLKLVNTIETNDQSVFGCGMIVAGLRYAVILMDKDSEVMVLKGKDRENNKKSLVVALSGRAAVLGANKDENTTGGQVRSAAEGIRDYLKNVGY